MPGIFVSYRRRDSAGHAGRVFDRLRDHFGTRQVFRDVNYLKGGEDFVEALARAVDSCKVFIVVIGCDWFDARDDQGRRRLDDPNDFIRLEVETALRRKVLVLPVLVEGATMREAGDLPEPLRPLARLQAIELGDHRWDFDIQELLGRIEEVIGPPGRARKRFAVVAAASIAVLAAVGTSGMWWPLLPFADVPPKVVASSPPVAPPPSKPNPSTDVGRSGGIDKSANPTIDAGRKNNEPSSPPANAARGADREDPKPRDPANGKGKKGDDLSSPPASPSNPPAPSGPTDIGGGSDKSANSPIDAGRNKTPSNSPTEGPQPGSKPDEPKPADPPNIEPPKPTVSMVPVPDLRGESIRNVFQRIQDLGLRMKVELNSMARGAPGTVVAQRPSPGSLVERGSVIELSGVTSLASNEHAAGSVFLRPDRFIDLDGDGEGRGGWDVTLSHTDGGFSLSFGNGAAGALLAVPGRLDATSCERIRASSTSVPISEAPRGQTVCVRTTAGRTTAISLGQFQSEPPELLIRYSTLAARADDPRPVVVAPPPFTSDRRPPPAAAPPGEPRGVVVAPPPPTSDRRLPPTAVRPGERQGVVVAPPPPTSSRTPPSTAVCEQAVQGRIAWDYLGSRQWRPENLARLCRGASDDQPARCFDRVMHGGVNWGGGTQWDWRNAIDLCEATTNADATIGCFQRALRAGNPWATAIAACDEKRSRR